MWRNLLEEEKEMSYFVVKGIICEKQDSYEVNKFKEFYLLVLKWSGLPHLIYYRAFRYSVLHQTEDFRYIIVVVKTILSTV